VNYGRQELYSVGLAMIKSVALILLWDDTKNKVPSCLDPYLDLLDITMVIDSLNQHPV
jgi:hypothetical protein